MEQQKQPTPELIWARLAHSRNSKQPSLSREQIVRAAIELADAEGTQALSMRRLAAKLEVGTMSLYWYVTRKEDLLDLLMDSAIGEIELPAEPGGDWRTDLTTFAQQTRTVLLRHTWLAAQLGTRPGLGPNWLKRLEFFLKALDGPNLSMTERARIFSLLEGYITGFVLHELEEEESSRRTGMTEAQWQASVSPYIQHLTSSGHYPYFTRFITESEDDPPAETFTFGLNRLLDGVASYINQTP